MRFCHIGSRALEWGLFFALLSCTGERPEGIRRAENGPGPRVVFDLNARPLPDIPFPNNLATRLDATSPTGRRLNISLEGATQVERNVRRRANQLEGFGTFAPITVRFTEPLDIANLVARHRANRDLADDAVVLVNVTHGSKAFGQVVPLDMGHGNFPLTVARTDAYFDNDTRRDVPNLFFDTTDEDKNGNGALDPGEDTDNDGLLDKPNTYPAAVAAALGRPDAGDPLVRVADNTITFYEVATNTLVVRPILPLEQESTYAVVLTKRLTGNDGNPVRSPFPFVNHTRQTDALRHLPEALAQNGLAADDIAFAWTFTTQGPTRDLEALRRGLYGVGPFARLAAEFPPDVDVRPATTAAQNAHLLTTVAMRPILRYLASALARNAPGVDALIASHDNIDYFVLAEIEAPNLLVDRDGVAEPGFPDDQNEVWDIDRLSGRATYGRHRVPFWCAVPRKERGNGPPFPVAFYSHGYSGSRLELLGFAGNMARHGIAACSVDAFGHGSVVPAELRGVVTSLFEANGLTPMVNGLSPSRARDLNNDGEEDSGGDFWSADTFHTRDAVRQSVLDTMAVIRALRAFDGVRRFKQDLNGDGVPKLAGDFDGDGVIDFGGPSVDYSSWGISLGGVVSSILAGIEPALTAAAPVAGGSGLSDIGIRSSLGAVYDAVILPVLGLIFVGEPSDVDGELVVSTIVQQVNRRGKHEVLRTRAVAPGDRVEIENRRNGKRYVGYADRERRFRLHIAADALDALEKRRLLKLPATPKGTAGPRLVDTTAVGDPLVILVFDAHTGEEKGRLDQFGVDVAFDGVTYPAGAPLVALARGWGLHRNTPEFRRFLAIAQTILEPGDPVNYAPHYFKDPLPSLDYDSATPGTNVLVIATAGDTVVPVATAIATARAAGIVDIAAVDPRYGKSVNDVLIDHFIVEGLAWTRRFSGQRLVMDAEDFSRGVFTPEVPRLSPPLRHSVQTPDGIQALRIPMIDPLGAHGFAVPEPDKAFDNPTFLIHMVSRFFATRGRELRDDVCMAKGDCAWLQPSSPPRP